MSGNRHLHLDIASGHFCQLTLCLREEEKKVLQVRHTCDLVGAVCLCSWRVLAGFWQLNLGAILSETVCCLCVNVVQVPSCLADFCAGEQYTAMPLQAKTELDKQAAELKQKTEALAEERQKMTPAGMANNDVLDLSVGGVPFSVKRATLTLVALLVQDLYHGST